MGRRENWQAGENYSKSQSKVHRLFTGYTLAWQQWTSERKGETAANHIYYKLSRENFVAKTNLYICSMQSKQ